MNGGNLSPRLYSSRDEVHEHPHCLPRGRRPKPFHRLASPDPSSSGHSYRQGTSRDFCTRPGNWVTGEEARRAEGAGGQDRPPAPRRSPRRGAPRPQKAPRRAGPSGGPSPAAEGTAGDHTVPAASRQRRPAPKARPRAGGRSSCTAPAPPPPLPPAGNSSAVTLGTGPPGPPPYGTRREGRPLPAPGRPRRTAPRPIGSGGRAKLLPGPAAKSRWPLPRSARQGSAQLSSAPLGSAQLARCRRWQARGCGRGKGKLGRGERRGDTAPLPGRPGKRSPGGGAAPPRPFPCPAGARGAAPAAQGAGLRDPGRSALRTAGQPGWREGAAAWWELRCWVRYGDDVRSGGGSPTASTVTGILSAVY